MLPPDADPALIEARQLYDEARLVRRAIASDRRRGASDAEIAPLTHDLHSLRERLGQLLEDPALRSAAEAALDTRAAQLRTAVRAFRAEAGAEALAREAARITGGAAASGRSLTSAEQTRIEQLRIEGQPPSANTRPSTASAGADWMRNISTDHDRDAVLDAVGRMRLRVARRQLRSGLLLTAQMGQIISETLPPILRGDPVLLVGETGGAKTALAEHLARAGVGEEPELVSGYGDITTAQVIGAHELRAADGATVSAFVDGPLLRAMRDGRPLILDELNAMPAEFLKRLNRILQLRPGDAFTVQEAADHRVTIARGFVIIATANEQTPHRYRGLDRLSAELINRFGANSYRVHYPDSGLGYADDPVENTLLATAAVVDDRGELPREISSDEIRRVARGAFISQQVFSGAHGEGFADYVSTEREIDGRPGLEESVLAPRTLVAILEKVANSGGTITLNRALGRFVESIMHREDRRVLALILTGQGFDLGAARRTSAAF